MFSTEWDIWSYILIPRLKNQYGRGGRKNVRARSAVTCRLLDTEWSLHSRTLRSCDCFHKTYRRPRRSTFHHGEKRGSWGSTPPDELVVIHCGGEGEIIWGLSSCSSGWPHSHVHASSTSWTQWMKETERENTRVRGVWKVLYGSGWEELGQKMVKKHLWNCWGISKMIWKRK